MNKTFRTFCVAMMILACGNAFGQENGEIELKPVQKYGYQDETGKMVIPLQFEDAYYFYEGLAAVELGEVWGFINARGEMVIKPQYNRVNSFSEGLAAVNTGDYSDSKWGFIDKTGKMVIKPQYDNAGNFSGNLAAVKIGDWENGKWGCIDKTGKIVIKPTFKSEPNIYGGYVIYVREDSKRWLLNNKGKTIIEFPDDTYVTFSDFKDGWGTIEIDEKYGLANENGWVKEPQFDKAFTVGELAFIKKDGEKRGILKKNGQWLIEPSENLDFAYYEEDVVSEGIALVSIKNEESSKYGFLNGTGWLVEPQYADAKLFSEGLAAVNTGDFWNGTWGFIDKTGKMVIKPQYAETKLFSEGLAAVYVESKWGYIDKAGKIVINPQYDDAADFSTGLAAVKVGEKWGYIDKTGKMVIKPQFDGAYPFNSGRAEVRIGDWESGETRYIDRNGNFTPSK